MIGKGTQSLIETLMGTVMKSLNLDPEMVKGNIAQIGQTVAEYKAQLDRIEGNQNLILKHLGISNEPTEPQQQSQLEFADGNGTVPPRVAASEKRA